MSSESTTQRQLMTAIAVVFGWTGFMRFIRKDWNIGLQMFGSSVVIGLALFAVFGLGFMPPVWEPFGAIDNQYQPILVMIFSLPVLLFELIFFVLIWAFIGWLVYLVCFVLKTWIADVKLAWKDTEKQPDTDTPSPPENDA